MSDSALHQHMVSAAQISSEIQAANEHGERIVVRASDHPDAPAAARAAFIGNGHASLRYQHITIEATYSSHGPQITGDAVGDPTIESTIEAQLMSTAAEDAIAQIIVNVRCAHPINDLTLIPVLGGLNRQLDDIARSEDIDIYLSNTQVVWILHEPREG